MYSQILVPTDGSPASDAAIEHAIDLARHYDARLHALYVVDGAAYSTLEAGADIVVEALESEGKEATRRVADAAADAGVDSRRRSPRAPPTGQSATTSTRTTST